MAQPAPTADAFSQHGLRCTPQRVAIYETLAASRSHPTADQLHRLVQDRHPGVSLATVYNGLEAMCSAGMVQRLAGGGGPARFDAVRRDHLHLRCQRTGELLDAPDDLSARLMQHIPRNLLLELQSRTGFRIDRLQIEAIGEAAGPTPS